ncbi:5-(carboxyamino)imidazole ribonucleotide synthase [Pengzhenrongella frigida]|uniref:N5-carboxyaminoimidazole ribonucleotide synthase n=1 Tax=Pengzhenrongella frigida TaxID=1259133 RepID=A0A4Q5N5F9_9MICO|nr:5-(carboxyamino)imidazole ribonucleotide synthase [Cellulomonas sp. HLT2-17]RYV51351.1 5-(carboxyamino)imidazole ribonucleotide synthase [Cellulomonas sp. HLT2-17]
MAAPVVAVVGGGQLARMMAPAAAALGVHLRALVEEPTSSAAQVICDSRVGAASDEAAIRALVAGSQATHGRRSAAPAADTPEGVSAEARAADVLTFEHEHVPNALLEQLVAEGHPVRPDAAALVHAQDKIVMRRRLGELGVPCPRWVELPDAAALEAFLAQVGGTAVVKTARGGYDGKGVRIVRSVAEAADWFAASQADGGSGIPLLAEEKIPFTRELAVLVARRPSGQMRAWPVVESVQVDGVCAEVIVPAPGLDPAVARAATVLALEIAEGLGVTGVLAVELFEVPGTGGGAPTVVVNELAMRPHNSGHWTIEGSMTSQFEQHLRAVLDLPLGESTARAPWTVMVNVLGNGLVDPVDALAAVTALDAGAKVQLYGKSPRQGRKLGHVTVMGDDLTEVRARAAAAAAVLRGATSR